MKTVIPSSIAFITNPFRLYVESNKDKQTFLWFDLYGASYLTFKTPEEAAQLARDFRAAAQWVDLIAVKHLESTSIAAPSVKTAKKVTKKKST